jgi:hypothetical protein
MSQFKVIWENEYDAKDARDAAEQAQSDLRDMIDWSYDVTDLKTGEVERIDLEIGVMGKEDFDEENINDD